MGNQINNNAQHNKNMAINIAAAALATAAPILQLIIHPYAPAKEPDTHGLPTDVQKGRQTIAFAEPPSTHGLPTLPEKPASQPLPAAVQKSMQSILPVMNADKDVGEPEKNWRTSYATLTVIDKVSKGNGQHTYFALTAGHVVSNTPRETRFPDRLEKIEVRTPAGKMEPLTFIGLVTDNNNPAYANRDLALLSFTSNTEIPVAQRASFRTNDPSTIESRYYIAGYPYGLTKVANGTPYGNDFTTDRNAHIGKPLQNPGKLWLGEYNLKGRATQIIAVPADLIRSISIQDLTNRMTGLEYPGIREFSRSEDATMEWNPSGTVVYTANTHLGHSGSPVLDQQGKVVAVHSIATADASGGYSRGRVASGGAFLDDHTNQIIDSLIQSAKERTKGNNIPPETEEEQMKHILLSSRERSF
jgi:V8-like Glu-specific endopeptidase